MDTAMIPSAEVVEMAIDAFGVDRIIFGSDEPLNLVRALVYNNPQLGERLITQEAYHWVDPKEHADYAYLARDVIHMHWSAILALKNATDKLPEEVRDSARESIFYGNARALFGFE
jgi:predicted TIM-barrel fold metal-dependent hydrolase